MVSDGARAGWSATSQPTLRCEARRVGGGGRADRGLPSCAVFLAHTVLTVLPLPPLFLSSCHRGCAFYETSARLKINNETCFFELVREIRKQNQAAAGGAAGSAKQKKKSKCVIL